MKKLLIFVILLMCISVTLPAQRGVNRLYRKYKRSGTENTHFMVPRPAFWLASLFPKHRDERKLVRAVKNIRLLAAEGNVQLSGTETQKMLNRAQASGYEPLLFVRDGQTKVSINAKERRGKIKGVFILVQEPDELVLISMRTKLKMSDLDKVLHRLQTEEKLNEVKLPPVLVPIQAKQNAPASTEQDDLQANQ